MIGTIHQYLTASAGGEMLYTMLLSMVPVIELRGGLPFGVGLGLTVPQAFCAAVIGNMIPVPFILLFIRRIFHWLRQKSERLESFIGRMERRAGKKGETVKKYRWLGLLILVAIPLPGTGAWTGALVAALLDMRLRDAVPSILGGVIIAGCIIGALTYGVSALL